MARLELDVVQTGSGDAASQAAKDAEALHQATNKLKQAELDEAAAKRKVEIAEARLTEVRKTAKEGSAQLLAAEDRLATAMGRLNLASAKTGVAMGNLDAAQSAATRSAKAVEEQATRSGNGFGKLSGLVGKGLAAFGLIGIVDKAKDALVEFANGSREAASKAEQASGAAQAVFGQDYPKIEAAAKKAATAVGLANSEYQQMAAVLGAGLKNQGLKDYADQAQKLVGLGADLAAQYGGSTQEAVDALSALMRGERDPIEKYGITMNEAAVAAEAMRLGLVGTTVDQEKAAAAANRAKAAQIAYNEAVTKHGKNSREALTASASLTAAQSSLEKATAGTKNELTNAAKAQATLSLVTQQSASAAGAFAREANTQEGAQQRLNAQMVDFQAKVGSFFAPAMTSMTSYMSQTMSGTTELSKVLGFLGNVIQVYVTPIVTKVQEGIALLRGHLDKATGSSANTEAMFSKVGAVITTVASITGKFIGGSLKALLDGLGYLIEYTGKAVDWIDRMSSKLMGIELPGGLGTIRDVVGDIEKKIASVVGWIGKLGQGSGPLAQVAALFRSDTVLTGAGTGWSLVPLVVPAPVTNVNVNVDGAALRGIIRSEIRAALPRGGDVR